MQYIYAISVITENTCRVLQRMAGIFARHRLNIEQLNVFETGNTGTSYFNIIVHSDPRTIERVINQLQRIFELLEVKINSQIPLLESELVVNPASISGTSGNAAQDQALN